MPITEIKQTTDKILFSADDAAAALSVSRAHLYSMHAAGQIPLPVRIGKRTLWCAAELRAWALAGGPAREKWQQIKGDILCPK
ncbi:MAG: AlpA family transcriptional regulator [Sedimentisphaerales bacterium]|nr:AlpA family transcriptional regulator [Sedimentisphaerales bacterium]